MNDGARVLINMMERGEKARQFSDDELIDAVVDGVLGQYEIGSKEEALLMELVDRFMDARGIGVTAGGYKSWKQLDKEEEAKGK